MQVLGNSRALRRQSSRLLSLLRLPQDGNSPKIGQSHYSRRSKSGGEPEPPSLMQEWRDCESEICFGLARNPGRIEAVDSKAIRPGWQVRVPRDTFTSRIYPITVEAIEPVFEADFSG